jgi:hypothetical protein
MIIPTFLIIPPFLVAFVLAAYQYYCVDPIHRLTDARAVMVWGAILSMLTHLLFRVAWPQVWQSTVVFFVMAWGWLALSIFMLKRMPPRAPY